MKSALLIGLPALVLCGCVSQSISIRSLPSEDPAAENAAAVESAAAFAAASATANAAASDAGKAAAQGTEGGAAQGTEGTAAQGAAGQGTQGAAAQGTQGAAAQGTQGAAAQGTPETPPPVTPEDAPSMYTYDPWERLNRFTYRFNARFDEAIFLPAANVYRRIPSPIRSGVHNFFDNLGEVDSVINYVLQWRLKLSARTLGRFVINSTVGIGGLFDVAAKLKLPGAPTGLSNTLGKWGMHPGPFLVIPLLGPSTLRDGIGYLGDYVTSYEINLADLYRGGVSWGLGTVNSVDLRSNISFRYYATGSPFEYENIRFLYVRKRLIEDEGLRVRDGKKGSKSEVQQENEGGEPAGK